MNNQINLIDTKNTINKPSKFSGQKPLRFVAISLLFIVSVSSMILFILIAISPIAQLKKKQKAASMNLSLFSTDIAKLSFLKERAKSANVILDKRAKYSDVLEYISGMLPRGVVITAVSTKNNYMSVTATGSSLLGLDNFIKSLRQSEISSKVVSNIKILSLSNEDLKDSFQVTLNMKIL